MTLLLRYLAHTFDSWYIALKNFRQRSWRTSLTNWIEYKGIGVEGNSFSNLFTEYLRGDAGVEKFFNGDFRNPSDWSSLLKSVERLPRNRSKLVQILTEQNKNFQCGVHTLANIDLLLNENTFAVVTGQQVGILSGPLYTVYKALTTIKLAQTLGSQFPDSKFVPIFWLESEDHDLAEAASVTHIDQTNELRSTTFLVPGASEGKNLGAVGSIKFDASMTTFLDSLEQSLIQTEFKQGIFTLLRTAYQPGMTFTQSFVHLLNALLEDSGLIFFDPNDAGFKKLLVPIFRRELETTPRSSQLVIERSVELEKQFHAQVKPRSINLFLHHHGGRYPLEPHPTNEFVLKGTRQYLSRTELNAMLESAPEQFSPNVVLRPLCQDFLLPTVAYIAGPSEVAYFAQFGSLYKDFNIPMPIIYPRASATIVEEKVEKVLNRFSLQPAEFFVDLEAIKQRVAEQVSDFKVEELFNSTVNSIEESLNSLRGGIQAIDQTLLPVLDGTLGKVKQSVGMLKEKTVAAQKRQHEVFLRQIDKAALHLFPNNNFQERELNVVYFLNKFGPEFVRWLGGEIQIDKFKHQIIQM